jgi:hypothetical protein
MSVEFERRASPVHHRRMPVLPTTPLGRWAAGLAVTFFPLVFAAALVPRAAAAGFVCGLAGGVTALVAIVRDRERAVTVFAALVPLAIAVGFGLAELMASTL